MIRIRCQDCGGWHSGQVAFCPFCGTLNAGGLDSGTDIAYYQKASARVWAESVGSLLYRRNLAQLLDWVGAVAFEALQLLLGPAWVATRYSERISFVVTAPETVHGLDLSRLKHATERLAKIGFEPNLDFVIPEEHHPSLYRLLAIPSEATWALVRLPSPAGLRSSRWEISFHSLLKEGGGLVSQPFGQPGPSTKGRLEFLVGSARPEDLFALHRQETFRRGGAAPVRRRPRPGTFFGHYARVTGVVTEHLVDRGLLKKGRGPVAPRTVLGSAWSEAIGSCHHCLMPVDETTAVRVNRGLLCRSCFPEGAERPVTAGVGLGRRFLAWGLDLTIVSLLLWLGLNLTRTSQGVFFLLLPLVSLGWDLLPFNARSRLGMSLISATGEPAGSFRLFICHLCWWLTMGAASLPALLRLPPWHELVAGVTLVSDRQ